MAESDSTMKYQELYELTKAGLSDELEGIRQLEEKASRYLSVMGLVLGISTLGVKFVIETIVSSRTLFDAILIAVLVVFLLFAFISILVLFKVLKTRGLSHFPINQSLLDLFQKHNYLDSIYALTRGNIEAVAFNHKIRLEKIQTISNGYLLMVCAISTLALFTVSLIIRPYLNN